MLGNHTFQPKTNIKAIVLSNFTLAAIDAYNMNCFDDDLTRKRES